MTDWQPIETAPDDGTQVDLWCESEHEGFDGQRFIDCYWIYKKWAGIPADPMKWHPTHWMPQPEPPK